MSSEARKMIKQAMKRGVWTDPGPAAMRLLLGENLDLPDMKLFTSLDTMDSVLAQLYGGYVDIPEFCMVRTPSSSSDQRLALSENVILASSVVPGDDVFVAAGTELDSSQTLVRVFDWRRPLPDRWVVACTLARFVERLQTA